MEKRRGLLSMIGTVVFSVIGVIYIAPILIVLMNSFKKKVFINKEPFILPTEKTWNGIENYVTAIDKYELLSAVGWTVFITIGSVAVILICTSMCAWYITRVKNTFTKMLYLLCAFSIVVPFQMVMFTLSLVADRTGLNTPWGNFHRYPVHERQLWTRRYGSCHGGFDPGRYPGYYILFVLSEIHHRRYGCRSSKRIR